MSRLNVGVIAPNPIIAMYALQELTADYKEVIINKAEGRVVEDTAWYIVIHCPEKAWGTHFDQLLVIEPDDGQTQKMKSIFEAARRRLTHSVPHEFEIIYLQM